VRTVAILGFNFFGASGTARFLNSVGRLDFGIKHKLLKEFDNAKSNKGNQ
jgi:hypothetical protein